VAVTANANTVHIWLYLHNWTATFPSFSCKKMYSSHNNAYYRVVQKNAKSFEPFPVELHCLHQNA